MYNTSLTEQEKESLIKYICILGSIELKNGHKIFKFYNDEIDLEDKFSAAFLLEKAFNNIKNQQLGV